MTRDGESLDYWVDAACLSFEEDLFRLMEERGISRADLARAIGASTAYVSKILNGESNYTLRTMAKLARAVEGVLQVRIVDEEGEVVRVLDYGTARHLDALHEGTAAASTAAERSVPKRST